MTEVEPAQSKPFTCTGNARMGFFAWEPSVCDPDVDNVETSDSMMWNPIAYSSLARDLKIGSDRVLDVYPWENAIEIKISELQENRKAETVHVYRGAIAVVDLKNVVCISAVVGSEFCISSDSGQKVFEILRSAVSRGDRVHISFDNIKSLGAAFLDSAIGQLYKGEIREEILDEMLVFENISPGRHLTVNRAIREAKEYYKDPSGYIAKLKEIFADD